MKTILAGLVLLLSCISISYAVGESGPTRPPNVSASNWIPLSQTSGFVVTKKSVPTPDAIGVEGYFMAQKDGTWVRLVALNAPQLSRAQ